MGKYLLLSYTLMQFCEWHIIFMVLYAYRSETIGSVLMLFCYVLPENENVRGMKVRDTEFVLLQFADDPELYLDGSKRLFIESVKILCFLNSWSKSKTPFYMDR